MGLCPSRQSHHHQSHHHRKVSAEQSYKAKEDAVAGLGTLEVKRKYRIDFSQQGKLGSGAYSTVYRCTSLEVEREECAVKVIRLGKMAPDELAALKVEVEILREIDHPNVIKLYDYFEDDIDVTPEPMAYIVTEILEGGELFDRIVERTYYSEFEARKVIQILLDVMTHLHDKNIAHRDLKPENLLLKSQKNDHSLKVADFGFAARSHGATLSTQCGTPNYVAPEIIRNEKYGFEVDMWSVGVLTFVLLGGYPPFHNDNQKELFRRIKHADFQFDPQYWNVVTDDAKDFITKLLVPNPTKRLTARQAMVHPWLVKGDHDLVSRHLDSALTNLQGFNAKRKFKAAAKMIITARRLSRTAQPGTEEESAYRLVHVAEDDTSYRSPLPDDPPAAAAAAEPAPDREPLPAQ
ncbi:hypothetical protein CTAYLR_002492 [Chrysophaeum taylorii]|uniref:Protein kinase domain-containing protein n=1 Tax=Chrysophaeum taylorii TaxID=2483200 RepID=A0AAD7XJB1_9STRA|nr:hypothetical protein CTAYLR_002492 [Chrysophaeum taylorii]